jgi:hypothetical protein
MVDLFVDSETLDLGFVAAKARKGWDFGYPARGAGLTRGWSP